MRKQLLLAESELNRAQLAEELQTVAHGVHSLVGRAKSFGWIISSTAVLAGALAAFRRGRPAEGDAKPSRLQSILKGAGLISTLWTAFRPRDRHPDGK
ncbi:MAG TPA: hypothetical protein VMR33_13330 [Candidatus Baltobacteraceae bacterium]|nr:hypothetical protein [Candidatus Baltobacteraceae bacterium]